MPPRKYTPKRKVVRKKYVKKATNRTSLVKLIKNISLKQAETKMAIQSNGFSCLHNVSTRIFQNHLATSQGITDGSALSNRIGDTVMPIGLKLYLQFRQPADRPNVSWKVWVLKIYGTTSITFVPVKTITSNLFLDPIDTEACSVVKVINFKAPPNFPILSGGLPTKRMSLYTS